MAASVAVNPDLNIRLFTAGMPAALNAAAAWIGVASPHEMGPWNVQIDHVDPAKATELALAAARAGVQVWKASVGEGWKTTRFQLGGTPEQLFDLTGILLGKRNAALGKELRAALTAFENLLVHPGRTLVMGILNVTPDSFSDGGRWGTVEAAVEHGLRMLDEGADVIDVGGESTRPGAVEVPVEEELRRVIPVIEGLRARTQAPISIDTRKAAVASRALEAGADWVNDVSGLTFDPALADVVAARPGTRLILMHSRARPGQERYSTEYATTDRPVYEDVVADTMRWLRARAQHALERGIAEECLWIDPGFGFGKTFEQNVEILRRLREYTSIGLPVLIGTSRKSTVGRLLGDLPPDQRLEGTAATVAWAIAQGASAVRVHDVKEMARVARVADVLRRAHDPPIPG